MPLLWFCKKHELYGSTMNYQLLAQFAMLGIKSQRI